ncbi:hypothetical protein GCM10023085_04610 [Actinomadura viridis]|uniref:DUF6745 domain-containing protein n=1 Tax=Actinomadura viridis TaxID=58110 RepID=A0A931GKU7_9ACTN|nr:hypothetical protein [Actinomadura viridis]MBG6091278.1 hypothetical protein [Actinomadura viridis]
MQTTTSSPSRGDVTLAWQATAFSAGPTGPGEHERAETAVRAAYAAAGLAPPERVVWVPSPAHGTIAAALIAGHREALEKAGLQEYTERLAPLIALPGGAGGSVREAVRTLPWEKARTAASSELGPREWAHVWARTGGRLWNQVNDLVDRVRRAIGELAGDDAEATALLRGATLDAVLGQHDAPFLALADHLGRLDGDGHPGDALSAMAEVARNAGWWWPYERIAILSERPAELHRDEPGRLHRGDGPALAYSDGFSLHAWRGMPMQAGFIESLTDLTPARIDAEENAEQRRVMLEIYGYDRYLAETGAKPQQRDSTGVLWRIPVRDDEDVVMVEVVNSTPEPDGSYRTYFLRVPPRTLTARQGVAWTFGLDARDYTPQQQT